METRRQLGTLSWALAKRIIPALRKLSVYTTVALIVMVSVAEARPRAHVVKSCQWHDNGSVTCWVRVR